MNYDKVIAELVVRVQELEEAVSAMVPFSLEITAGFLDCQSRIDKAFELGGIHQDILKRLVDRENV